MKRKFVSIILLLLIISGVFTLNGCSDKEIESAKNQVILFLDGYKEKDPNIFKYVVGSSESDNIEYNGISRFFAEHFTYEIKECKKNDENTFNIKIEASTIDFGKLFEETYNFMTMNYPDSSSDEIVKKMEENIINNKFEKFVVECNILVLKIKDEYKIQFDASLANALTGGMNEYINSI